MIIDRKVLSGKLEITLTLEDNDIKVMKLIESKGKLEITSCCRTDEEWEMLEPVDNLKGYGLIEDRLSISEYELTKLGHRMLNKMEPYICSNCGVEWEHIDGDLISKEHESDFWIWLCRYSFSRSEYKDCPLCNNSEKGWKLIDNSK